MRNEEPQSVDLTLAESWWHGLGVPFWDQGREALPVVLIDRKENV
jgi:hypothetical protein